MATDARARRPRRLIRAATIVATVSAIGGPSLGASAASASLLPSCAAQPTSTAFARWGDSSNYFLMPGGGFEPGTPGWALAGPAAVAAGNETFFANGTGGTHNLALPTGAQTVSPTVCVAMGENTIRLFVKNSGVASSVLHVQAYVQNPLTGLVLSTGFDIQGTAAAKGWAPSNRLLIPNLLGGVLGTQRLTLVFTTRGAPATWNIDDVFVDPFKSR